MPGRGLRLLPQQIGSRPKGSFRVRPDIGIMVATGDAYVERYGAAKPS